MRLLAFIVGFALFLPVLLPERNSSELNAPVFKAEAKANVAGSTSIEAAKQVREPKARDLESLVNALGVLGDVINTKEGHCLAQAVYFEARSEPLDGQLAVAQVVMNRVKASKYPDSICGVVFHNEHMKNRCQFSFACDGLSDNAYEMESWEIARRIAYIALSGYWEDITDEATHYHAEYVNPLWAVRLEQTGHFGSHVFYRYRDTAS